MKRDLCSSRQQAQRCIRAGEVKVNQRIIDIEYDPEVLNIFSPVVLRMIKNGISGWEDMVPAYVDNVIKQKKLFGSKLDSKISNENQNVKNPFI